MREIKFRAWDKEDKKMRYPNVPVNGQAMGINDIFLHIAGPVHQHLLGRIVEAEGVSHLELMQYTGLKDKNGKPSYESDIVKFFGGKIDVIEFRQGAFCLKNNSGTMAEWGPDFEILGTIYEHGHLLKGE